MKTFLFYLGATAGFVLPLFNIPFILKIRREKNSRPVSLIWAVGAWVCIVLMLPQALLSVDWSYKIFGVANGILFTAVFIYVLRYRKG